MGEIQNKFNLKIDTFALLYVACFEFVTKIF